MSLTVLASLIITYAVVQTIVFILLIRLLDPYEREPLSLLGLMTLWGAIGATSLSAAGNVVLKNWLPPDIATVFGQAIYAPVVEELAKGIALVAFVILSVWAGGRFGMPRFEGVTDGIVYGAAIGLGFAFTEDVLYLLIGASQEGLQQGFVDYLSRRDFFGVGMLHHAIYTATFGVSLGLATWMRGSRARLFLPGVGLLTGMFLHAFNNGWVQFTLSRTYGFDRTLAYLQGGATRFRDQMHATAVHAVDVVRFSDYLVVVLFLLMTYLWLRHQRTVIRVELEEEAASGLISRTELELLPRYWQRTWWYWQLIKSGQWERWRILKRIHNELVDLAFMKRRMRRTGVGGDDIERRRKLIDKLKTQKIVFI
jgi:RsiW-degrading membrane proteinase PrsW (M82 family)